MASRDWPTMVPTVLMIRHEASWFSVKFWGYICNKDSDQMPNNVIVSLEYRFVWNNVILCIANVRKNVGTASFTVISITKNAKESTVICNKILILDKNPVCSVYKNLFLQVKKTSSTLKLRWLSWYRFGTCSISWKISSLRPPNEKLLKLRFILYE